MQQATIRRLRLLNQQLTQTSFSDPAALVSWLGVVQAQDFPMSKWALGVRLPGTTETDIEHALNEGKIVRTHLLRPTWHLVAAEDLRWMLRLSAPQIQTIAAGRYRQLELDAALRLRSNDLIGKLLEGGNHLTRQEITRELFLRAGIRTDEMRGIHLLLHAEMEGIVCSGRQRNGQCTYALLDERVPRGRELDRPDALAELARRYFRSHGPATLTDFAWWSGLTKKDARAAIEANREQLQCTAAEGETYWFYEAVLPYADEQPSVRLLPAFDEFTISYKNRSASLDALAAREAILKNGIFKPILVIDGRVTGIWKRSEQKGATTVALTSLQPLDADRRKLLAGQLAAYAQYLQRPVALAESAPSNEAV